MWDWFRALDAGRSSSGFGPNPISWAEVMAYQQLHRVRLSTLEAQWVRELDRKCLQAAMEGKQ